VKKGKKTIRNPDESSGWLFRFKNDFWILEDCLSKKNSFAKIGYRYERPNIEFLILQFHTSQGNFFKWKFSFLKFSFEINSP